jgi:hypothetical protein
MSAGALMAANHPGAESVVGANGERRVSEIESATRRVGVAGGQVGLGFERLSPSAGHAEPGRYRQSIVEDRGRLVMTAHGDQRATELGERLGGEIGRDAPFSRARITLEPSDRLVRVAGLHRQHTHGVTETGHERLALGALEQP